MADIHHQPEIDKATGTATTGHEWDGIKELETPLPRWWLWTFYATIIWAVAYWVVYPAWPTITSSTQGVLGWHSRDAIVDDLKALQLIRGEKAAKIASTSAADVKANPDLLPFALAQGKAAFGDNCAPCHGSGAAGTKGFPNLNDDDWLWGGSIDAIKQTITFGIRSGHDQARVGNMPPFADVLKKDEIAMLARHVRTLSGLAPSAGYDKAKGAKLFADNCAACHGDNAKGNQEVGAPNLTDGIWLYAPDEATIAEGITNGRGGVMPAWTGRLDPATITSLAVYIHSLGGGK